MFRSTVHDAVVELEGVTHFIIDEAHERTAAVDFLLYLLQQELMKRKECNGLAFKILITWAV